MKLLSSLPCVAFNSLVVAAIQVPGRVRWLSYRAARPSSSRVRWTSYRATRPSFRVQSCLFSHLVHSTPVTMKVESAPDPDRYGAALISTALAVTGAAVFGAGINYMLGTEKAVQYVAGYIVEMSLSVDNLFVFLLLFKFFKVPFESQNRVLSYGIFGAVVMRAIFIALGETAMSIFRPVLLGFAAILFFSSYKLLSEGESDEVEDLRENWIVSVTSNTLDATDSYDGNKFFTSVNGVQRATPLLLVLVCVELSDVIFAIDSIPAVFAVTKIAETGMTRKGVPRRFANTVRATFIGLITISSGYNCVRMSFTIDSSWDPFIVYTSNIWAIINLRSLYTILSSAVDDLQYLRPAVAVVLGFVGAKIGGEFLGYEIPTDISLVIIVGLLGVGIAASLAERGDEKTL